MDGAQVIRLARKALFDRGNMVLDGNAMVGRGPEGRDEAEAYNRLADKHTQLARHV